MVAEQKQAVQSYRSVLRRVFYIDLDRCIGCKSCQVACAREHIGKPLITVQILRENSIPLHCQHCESAACIAVCPKEAIEKDEQGIVLINEVKCVACGACIAACPFGILHIDEERKVVIKCDLCRSRIEKGEQPACVQTCPAEAIRFTPCIGCNACVVACPFAKQYSEARRGV